MATKEQYSKEAQDRLPIYPVAQDSMESQLKIKIENDVFIISHTYTGTRTLKEVFEDFIKRAIASTSL